MSEFKLFNPKYRIMIVELEDKIDVEKLVNKFDNGSSEVIEVSTINRAISTMGFKNIDYVVITSTKANSVFIDFCNKQHVPCSVYTCQNGKKNHIKKGVSQSKVYSDLHRLIHDVQTSLLKRETNTKLSMSTILQ